MKKKMENVPRVQNKVLSMRTRVVGNVSPMTQEEVSDTVEVLKERLEEMKNKKRGFYAPKVSLIPYL